MRISLLLFLLLPIVIFLAGCGGSEIGRAKELMNQQSNGAITIPRNNIDLGTIKMSEGLVDIPFTFRNDGEEPVVLLQAATSCMCTEAVVKSNEGVVSRRIKMPGHGPIVSVDQVLDPGEDAELIATYDPNAHGPKGTGPIMRDITIETNSTRTPKVTFRFRGNVVP